MMFPIENEICWYVLYLLNKHNSQCTVFALNLNGAVGKKGAIEIAVPQIFDDVLTVLILRCSKALSITQITPLRRTRMVGAELSIR